MHVQNQIDADLPDRFVSREKAAAYLDLSPSTLATWASLGIGPRFTKLSDGQSGAVRYSLADLRSYMADPQAYRPRLVAPFRKPELLKRGGNPKVTPAKARPRRGKGSRGV